MEKTNFTKARPLSWMTRLGTSFLVIAVWCLAGFTSANAQDVKLPASNQTYTGCAGTYTDIGGEDGLYDAYPNNTTYRWTFCPTDPTMQVVKLSFVDFDIHPSDVMAIYDSNGVGAAQLIIDQLAGGAVSEMAGVYGPAYDGTNFGTGWVQASCKNFSGCLTVTFADNGDVNKGEGWKFHVSCEAKATSKVCGTAIINAQANCALGYARHPWKAPTITSCGSPAFVALTSTCVSGIRAEDFITPGVPDTILADGTTYEFYFPIGRATLTANVVGFDCNNDGIFDPATESLEVLAPNAALRTAYQNKYRCTTSINVAVPGLAANDNVTIGLGAGCQAVITPDIILEDPCIAFDLLDLISWDFGYMVSIETENGVKTGYFNKEGNLEFNWPIVSGADVVCKKRYKVTVTRRILTDKDCDGDLRGINLATATLEEAANAALASLAASYTINNGDDYVQDVVWGYLTFEDKIAPEIENPENDYMLCYALAGKTNAQIETLLDARGKNELEALYAFDDCGLVDTTVADWVRIERDCEYDRWYGSCNDAGRPVTESYERLITVTDYCGNTASAKQYIDVIQPAIQMPLCVELDCKKAGDISPAALAGIDPVYVPFFDPDMICYTYERIMCNNPSYSYAGLNDNDEVAYTDHASCGYAVTYNDQRVDICEGEYKIFRRWTVFNWCTGEFETGGTDGKEYVQIIVVKNNPDFTINLPEKIYSKQLNHNCEHPLVLPNIDASSCGAATDVQVQVNWKGTYKPGQTVYLPLGENAITYTAKFCNHVITKTFYTTVYDWTPPVAVCESFRQVALNTDGAAAVFAESFDDGSNDQCGPVYFKVIRMNDLKNTQNGAASSQTSAAECNELNGDDDTKVNGNQIYFDDKVKFCCADLGKAELLVVMRVFDVDPGAGPVHPSRMAEGGDLFGRFNDCMVDVDVVDKIVPMCMPPADVTVDCDKLPADLDKAKSEEAIAILQAAYGVATTQGGCAPKVKELAPIFDLVCNFGKITRRFQAESGDGKTKSGICTQVIYVPERHDYWIKFPKDVSGPCASVIDTAIEVSENSCDLLSIRVEDQKFVASGEECFKLFRTFKVINWCEWDKISPAIVVGRDEDGDNKPGDEDVYVNRKTNANGTIYIDKDLNISSFWRKIEKADYLWKHRGFYEYTQVITVYDDVDPMITAAPVSVCESNGDCEEGVTVPFEVMEECTPNDLTITHKLKPFGGAAINDPFGGKVKVLSVEGSVVKAEISGGTYPIGKHAFVIRVVDGCGNIDEETVEFEVKDCKAPTPICINGLTQELMNVGNGMAEVWVTDFLVSDIYDCTGQGPETKNGLLKVKKFSINKVGEARNAATQAVSFDCTELGFQQVEIWAYDQSGNYDKCETFINITDLDGFCNQGSGSAKVAGAIKSETNDNIKGVTVTLSGEANKTVTTAADGVYNFSVDKGMDVTITPSKDDNPLAGISTFDLVKISKHILRVELLDSPYKMIAADVNNSKTISALDLVELRKLILFVNNDFSNNSSWRFVKKDYVFPQVSNPWAAEFPEVASVNNVAADQLAADFVAIKIGDVTGEAYRNAATGVENRSAGEFVLNVADQNVVAGREYTVTFNAAEVANIEGYQFSMNLKGLELVEVVEGVATAENFGLALVDEGVITTSWNGTADSEELFSLVFKATANGKLSEMVQVTSQLTAAEAYNANEEVLNVALRFNGQEVANGFELFQNVPNPFNGKTVIGFNLPENGSATLRVYDVAGKVLKVVRGDYAKGYNQVELESSQLPATGVLYYTLETNMGTATKKMVVID